MAKRYQYGYGRGRMVKSGITLRNTTCKNFTFVMESFMKILGFHYVTPIKISETSFKLDDMDLYLINSHYCCLHDVVYSKKDVAECGRFMAGNKRFGKALTKKLLHNAKKYLRNILLQQENKN
ncbi:Uncharacterised protein g3401 [Pycnogonum litorale]